MTVSAVSAGTAYAQLDEIIVTAEFRTANVQDTPVAITAVNAEMLEARGQTNILDVAAQAPNVSFAPGGQSTGSSMIAFIRGVGQTDFNYALEPGVGMYVDEIYYPNLTGSMVELLDIDRVEILRGPQGTLAGRNSIGGAVKIFSREPGQGNDGTAELVVGDYDHVEIKGAADFTFIEDKLAARVSGVSRSRNGYVERLDYKCVHPNWPGPTFSNGRLDTCKLGDLGGQSFTGGRVSLLWTPSETVRVKAIADVINEDNESGALVTLRVNEQVQLTNGWGQGTFLDTDGDLSTTADWVRFTNEMVAYGEFRGDPVVNSPYVSYATFLDPLPPQPTRPYSPVSVDPGVEFDDQGLSIQVDWDMTDNISLKWISATREYEDIWAQDTDGAPFNTQVLTQGVAHEHSTHELRFTGRALNDRLDWTAGAFYVDQNKAIQIGNINLHYAQLNFIHGPDPTPSDSTAIFAHTTWALTDNMNLSLGYRATEDNKFYQYRRRNPDGTLPQPCNPANGPPGNINNPPNCALAGLDLQNASFSSDRTDYRVALDYHITDNVMVYGQVATGYKGGGINPRPFFVVQIEEFGEEEVDSLEFGFKTTLADNRVRLNGAIFSNEQSDIQLNQSVCETPIPPLFFGPPCAQPANVGSADVEGIELELELAPTDNLLINFTLASLDFQYTELGSSVAVTLDMITPFTPEQTWSVGIQNEWPLAGGGSFTARLDANYQDEIYTAAINVPTALIEDYTLGHARFTWRSASRDWEAALDISNLTDEVYFLSLFDQFSSTGGVLSGTVAPPRMWTVHLKKNFGL